MKKLSIYAIIIGALIIDQLTKWLIMRHMSPTQSIPVINGVLDLRFIHNTGAAFGMFQNGNTILLVTSLILVCGMIWYIRKVPVGVARGAMAMIIGGAMGNIVDRILHRHVVDFIDFHIIRFPTFNFADTFVFVGALIWAVMIMLEQKKV